MLSIFLTDRLVVFKDDNIQRECEHAQQIYRRSIEDLERETEEKIRSLFFLSRGTIVITRIVSYSLGCINVNKSNSSKLNEKI